MQGPRRVHRLAARLSVGLAAVCWAVAPGAQEAAGIREVGTVADAGSRERLEAELHRVVDRFPGRVGVWVEHLATGVEAGVDPDTPYGMASTYRSTRSRSTTGTVGRTPRRSPPCVRSSTTPPRTRPRPVT